MLEQLHSCLQATFIRLVGNLLETVARERKARTSKSRRRIILEGPEALESRITPSTADYWIPTSGTDWNNPANWTDANGAHVVPTSDSDVEFGTGLPGSQIGNGDCTLPASGGVSVNSISIYFNYTSTLTLNAPLTVDGGFYMTRGNIAQPNGNASGITCYGPLDWEGGTIGSQTNGASYLALTSGDDTISNSLGLVLGDNLMNNGGQLEIAMNALVTLTNNASITNNSFVYFDAGQAGTGIKNASGSNGALINYGLVQATAGGRMSCIPVVNSTGGQFNIGDDSGTPTSLSIFGDANPQNGVSFMNNGGVTAIYAGSFLNVAHGFTQQSGTLDIAGVGANGSAKIGGFNGQGGDVKVNGGSITFDAPDDFLQINSGNFTLDGGTLVLNVDVNANQWNAINTTGNTTVTNSSTITVNTVDIPPEGMPKKQWAILYGGPVTVGSKVNWNDGGLYTKGYDPVRQDFYLQS